MKQEQNCYLNMGNEIWYGSAGLMTNLKIQELTLILIFRVKIF